MRCHELSTQKVKICVFKLSYLVPLLYLSDTINYQNNPENEDEVVICLFQLSHKLSSGTISLLLISINYQPKK